MIHTFVGFNVVVNDSTMTGTVHTTQRTLNSELKHAIRLACEGLGLHQHCVDITHGVIVDRVHIFQSPGRVCFCHHEGFVGEMRWVGVKGKVRVAQCKACFNHMLTYVPEWDVRSSLVWEELDVVPEEVKTR